MTLCLHHKVGKGALSHLWVCQDHLDVCFGQMVNYHDLEWFLFLVDRGVVLVNPQEPVLVVKYQKLVQFNICQVLVVLVRAHLISPAVVFVLVRHPVELLVIVDLGELDLRLALSLWLRHVATRLSLLNSGYYVRVARLELRYPQVHRVLGLNDVEFETGPFKLVLGRTHQHQMLFFVETQGYRGNEQWNSPILRE